MKTKLFKSKASLISIFACIVAIFSITVMSSCSRMKVKATLATVNSLMADGEEGGPEFYTEGDNVILYGTISDVEFDKEKDSIFAQYTTDYVKNDTNFSFLREELVPMFREADYESFVLRFVDASGDTMDVSIPLEEL